MRGAASRARQHSSHPAPLPSQRRPERIISGGQTGVDRAALDTALAAGIPIGGWCPRGRRAENGRIPERYPLDQTESRSYAVRTEWNVRDSDGTLIVALDEISSGTRLTIEAARSYGRPLHIVHLLPDRDGLITHEPDPETAACEVTRWIAEHNIRILNVAGPRGSASDSVYPLACDFLTTVLKQLASD